MIFKFATKRDINGNRYYLAINTDSKEYSRMDCYYHKSDFITITQTEMNRLINKCTAQGFTEKNYI